MIRRLILGGCLLVALIAKAQHTDIFGNDIDVVVSDETVLPPSSTFTGSSGSTSTIMSTGFSVSSPTSTSSPAASAVTQGAFKPFEKLIVVHGALSTFAFLAVLPAGIYLARFTRTFNNKWYTGHWIIQFIVGGLFILVGVGLGFRIKPPIERHSLHKTLGKVVLFLYALQCGLGIFIHYVKIRFRWRRPPQNYLHAILGLTVVGAASYQIYLGFAKEWPGATGRPSLGHNYTIIWLVWSIMLIVLYAGGLALLPRQWIQERGSRNKVTTDPYSINLPEYSKLTDPDTEEAWQYRDSVDVRRN